MSGISVNNQKSGVVVRDDKVTINVTGGIGPKGDDGGAGVSSVNGLAGALTLAVVGGTVASAGSTITITVTGGGGVSSWNDLTDKPTEFPPAAHTQSATTISVAGGYTQFTPIPLTAEGAMSAISGALENKCDSVDARLSNAREWSAATVTQAAAEAGTDTARVAWTVHRLWQAVAAWWAASSAKTKLDGIAAGATANSSDATLLARANHTGTQSYTTITGLGTLATQSGTFSGTSSGTNTGDQTISLIGDVTGSGTGSFAATLSASGVTAGTYTSVTVDAKGRVTAGSNPAVAYSSLSGVPSTFTPSAHTQAWSTITSTPTTLSGYGITDGVTTSDARMTDARAPTGAAGGDLTGTYPNPTIAAGAVVTADLADGAVTLAKTTGLQKAITSSTSAPTGGSSGDIHLRYSP